MIFRRSINKLMVVAHPDDKSIFGGGALLSEKGWKVICLTNASNEQRSKEFYQAMKFAGASGEMWDYPDVYDGTFDEEKVIRDLRRVLWFGKYELVVTHNLHGEYGHTQHMALSRIVHRLHPKNLHVFDTSEERLPDDMLNKKWELLRHYQSQMYVIDGLDAYIQYEQIVRVP